MPALAATTEVDDLRRTRLLGAAERAFARHGFHGASMQHVASEAGMSAGNLYRYFQSKDAIVAALTARDQAAMTRDFHELLAAPDLFAAMGRLLRKHLLEEPAWRNQLVLEIWAEAARNPTIAALCAGVHRTIEENLGRLVASMPATSGVAADPGFLIRVVETVVSGLIKRRAIEPDFDGEAEVGLALGVFRAAFGGAVQPYWPADGGQPA